jgi:hypothetical protein
MRSNSSPATFAARNMMKMSARTAVAASMSSLPDARQQTKEETALTVSTSPTWYGVADPRGAGASPALLYQTGAPGPAARNVRVLPARQDAAGASVASRIAHLEVLDDGGEQPDAP